MLSEDTAARGLLATSTLGGLKLGQKLVVLFLELFHTLVSREVVYSDRIFLIGRT